MQTVRLFFLGAAVILCGFDTALAAKSLPMISASGSALIGPNGSQILLKGCNLGNYLMLESWMFGKALGVGPEHSFPDGAFVYRTLRGRFGEDRSDHLIELYREGWITPRDLGLIKSFGFNVVRLPFDYRLVQEDKAPFAVKSDAFRWLDHAVDMAEDAGIYVILDLHGTPGGQSMEGHTGEAGQDRLWNSEEDQNRTVEVWRAVADHFRDRGAIAAYDLINEPYGNHREDCRPVLARLMPEIYQAIRSTGDRHVVFFAGALNGGIGFYGNPHDRGMTNVGFTEHFYPGMFGSKAALETQARVLTQELPAKLDYVNGIASPYYVGEFNVVLEAENPWRVMRAYYDRFAEYGWPATMWSYKLISARGGVGPDAWYMVTNARPLPSLDLESSSYEDFEDFFAKLASMPLVTNDRLRDALSTATPESLYLARFPRLATAPPSDSRNSELNNYSSVDLGDAARGYTKDLGEGGVLVMGGGSDIFGASDSCRFVSQAVRGDSADVRATIYVFEDSAEFAKAGVMARWGEGDRADAAMAMVNVFPDGTIALVSRRRSGSSAVEKKVVAGAQLPVELRLQISSGRAIGTYRNNSGTWKTIGSADVPMETDFRTGLAVCAHGEGVLTTVKARLGAAADNGLPAPGDEGQDMIRGPSLLANGSFEQQGGSGDLAAGWNRWGQWMNREAAWTPTHSGVAEIGYHHWQITSEDSSGLWQDVNVEAGKRYTFSIYAQRDIPNEGQTEARSLELRLESVTDRGQLTLNTQTFDVSRLASGKEWTRLLASGTANSPRMRVLLVISPAADEPRGGAVKLDDAMLTVARDGK